MEKDPKRKKKKRRRQRKRSEWLWFGLAAAVFALLLFGGMRLADWEAATVNENPETSAVPSTVATDKPKLEIDPNAGALITPSPAPQEPGVAIPGWGSMTIPAGVTEVSTSMQNPETNEGWYYLTFELRLKETNEVIFTTGLIPPGQYCNKVTLTRALEPGEYPAIIHVQPYRISDQSPTNNADMETVLIVK